MKEVIKGRVRVQKVGLVGLGRPFVSKLSFDHLNFRTLSRYIQNCAPHPHTHTQRQKAPS